MKTKMLAKLFIVALFCGNTIAYAMGDTLTTKELGGDYYFGDGLGVNCSLKLSPADTFGFQWHGCMGLYDQNEGKFEIEKGILILYPEKPNERKGFQGTATRFFIIDWSGRIYLVPEEELLDFCNAINQGREPRRGVFRGNFYIKKGDDTKPIKGWPTLPGNWNEYLLQTPIHGRVTSVQNKREGAVNMGSRHGLKTGMVVTARDRKNRRFSQLVVKSVDTESAKVELKYSDDLIVIGDAVSTRLFSDE